MAILEMAGVTKEYPLGKTTVHALRGIDFAVEAGELLSIVGPSGSGKTTLLNMIGCIDSPTAGSIHVHGQPLSGMTDRQLTNLRLNRIGFIFQTFNLIPVLNVIENIEFPLVLMKEFSRTEIRKRTMHFVEAVGLAEHVNHRPAELSGGQRQRVAIARALVTHPDIVLADEPTANLDEATGESILGLMQRMNETEKTTFIFSTHDANVLRYAKRVVRIHDGLIVKE